MKNKVLIIIFALALALCAAVILIRGGGKDEAKTAEILLGGEVERTIDLSAAAEPYDLRIESENGYNIVHVEGGAVSVTEADCPDKVCVKQGRITGSAYPIVCLPHKLTIRIVSGDGGEIDAVTGR